MRPALLMIDMQEAFLQEAPEAFKERLLPNCTRLLAIARTLHVPIVHVVTRYGRDKSDWPAAWRHRNTIWCLEGSPGAEILPGVRPEASEETIVKTRFTGFYETNLDRVLQQMRIDTLFLAGYSGDVCVRLTAMDAYNRGYRLFLVLDCIYSTREDIKVSLEYLRWLANAAVVKSTEMASLVKA